MTQPPKRAFNGAARFWLPFVAIVLAFAGLAVAYSHDEGVREPAPGAARRAPAADESTGHGLEPERSARPPVGP